MNLCLLPSCFFPSSPPSLDTAPRWQHQTIFEYFSSCKIFIFLTQGRKSVASKPCKHMPSNSWIPGSARQARKRGHGRRTPGYLKHGAQHPQGRAGMGRTRGSGAARRQSGLAPAPAPAFALRSPAPQRGRRRGRAEAPGGARGGRGAALGPDKAALPPADRRLIEDCH